MKIKLTLFDLDKFMRRVYPKHNLNHIKYKQFKEAALNSPSDIYWFVENERFYGEEGFLLQTGDKIDYKLILSMYEGE